MSQGQDPFVTEFRGSARHLQELNPSSGPTHVVRLLRGRRMSTRGGVFGEFAAAFQFPWYFGNNWDALDECMTDLEWLEPFDEVSILIMDYHEMLSGDLEGRSIFRRSLNEYGECWRVPRLRDINATKVVNFRVVLQLPADVD